MFSGFKEAFIWRRAAAAALPSDGGSRTYLFVLKKNPSRLHVCSVDSCQQKAAQPNVSAHAGTGSRLFRPTCWRRKLQDVCHQFAVEPSGQSDRSQLVPVSYFIHSPSFSSCALVDDSSSYFLRETSVLFGFCVCVCAPPAGILSGVSFSFPTPPLKTSLETIWGTWRFLLGSVFSPRT